VDESMLTGESMPVAKSPGDAVVGGTVNGTGSLTVGTTRVGADTVLARIVEMVQHAQGTKPPIQRTVDVVASRFVPAVIAVSLITFCVWMVAGPEPRTNFAVVTSVAVLVIKLERRGKGELARKAGALIGAAMKEGGALVLAYQSRVLAAEFRSWMVANCWTNRW